MEKRRRSYTVGESRRLNMNVLLHCDQLPVGWVVDAEGFTSA